MMREDRKRAEQRQKKIARRKREVRRMKRKLYKAGILAAAGIIVLAVILMLCGSGNAKKSAKKTSSAKTKTETSEETETKTPEEIEAEKIQEVLDSDQYKDQLGELYKKNPETKEIILNREKYSDDLLTWLFDHQEALQWVIDYPEQSARSEEELSAQGLQAVDLKDYRIQNHIPVYFQWSEVWGYASYGSENIGMGGCGPTSLSMVATGLTGNTSFTPKYVADMSVNMGYYVDEVGTDWTLMTAGASELGINSAQLTNWSEDTLKSELSAGHPIICSMGPGDFTNQGHFIVLSGLTEEGKVLINDPNSKINSRKKWDLNTIINQMNAAWSFWVSKFGKSAGELDKFPCAFLLFMI